MVCLRTVRVDDVLQHAAAKLRTWQIANETHPLERIATPQDGRFVLGIDRALSFLSRVARWKGAPAVAQWFAQQAYRANPRSSSANLALALALRREGMDEEALPYLLHAAGFDGQRNQGNWELARLLLRLEREDTTPAIAAARRAQLLSALRAAVTSTDNAIRAEASIVLSNLLNELGDHAGAREAAGAAMGLGPKNMRSLRAKANALMAGGELVEARSLHQSLLARDPDNSELARRVGILSRLYAPCDHARKDDRKLAAAVLIAVGGGLGDMLHTTPMICNLVKRTGIPVEVMVASDHPEAEFLFRNPAYVSRVWGVCPEVLERAYKTVFLTYSLGNLRLPFRAAQVVVSRAWRPFRAGHLNETIFNLEAAQALLGISYASEDATHYFAGDLVWSPPSAPLVGLHAGSKGGRWLSKRWPHFAELTERLKAHGIAVASFGTPDEYVVGSENCTGGSIEEMSRAMLDCSIFVSNDSGPMHIASAAGMPTIALYAPTDPFTHLPLAPNVTALALEKPCAPCEVKRHPYFSTGVCRCIGEMPVTSVEGEVLEVLACAARQADLPSDAST